MWKKKKSKRFQYLIKENIEERWLSSSGIAGYSKLPYQKQVEEIRPSDIILFNTDDAGLDESIEFQNLHRWGGNIEKLKKEQWGRKQAIPYREGGIPSFTTNILLEDWVLSWLLLLQSSADHC